MPIRGAITGARCAAVSGDRPLAGGRGAAWTTDREKAALARDIARLCPASPGAGVIGAPSVAAQPAFAALANGILVNAADDDDTHKRALLHVGSVVVPAALATLNRHPVDPRNITRITNETDRIVTTHCSSKEVG